MDKQSSDTVLLSHDAERGYDYGNSINLLVSNATIQKYIKSYVSMITAYSSNPRYISIPIVTSSYFTKDNYAVFIESYPKKDNRLFLESKIRITDLIKNRTNPIGTKFQNEICVPIDTELTKTMQIGMMLSLLSDNTTMYVITDDAADIEYVRSMFFSFGYTFLCNSSCIEVLGGIPEVKASIMLCRCIYPEDKATFKNGIMKGNYVIVDFSALKPLVEINICRPCYSQSAISKLLENNDFQQVYTSFVDVAKTLGESDLSVSKNIFNNTVSYCLLKREYPQYIKCVSASSQEKSGLEEYLISRGVRF